jgi:hypothetical protein
VEEEIKCIRKIMKPDLFSEILLLASGELIFVSLLLTVAAALTRA